MRSIGLAFKLILSAVALGLIIFIVVVQYRAVARERSATKPPLVGQLVEVNGLKLHMAKDGSGPPLILLHGASGNLRDFSPLVAELSERFTVIRFDRPGLGRSELPREYRTIWRNDGPDPLEQAHLLSDAYRTLGLGPAIVMGQSYGGAVALAWALERPEDVAALVPVSAVSNRWTDPLDRIYRVNAHPLGAALFVPLITAFATPAGIETVLGRIFAPQNPPDGYADLVGAELSLRRKALIANARQVYLLREAVTAMAHRYGTITQPTEILHGDADIIVPLTTHSEPLSRQIPNAVLTRLPGVGHMPHHSTSQEVVDAIDRAAMRADLHDGQSLGKVSP